MTVDEKDAKRVGKSTRSFIFSLLLWKKRKRDGLIPDSLVRFTLGGRWKKGGAAFSSFYCR